MCAAARAPRQWRAQSCVTMARRCLNNLGIVEGDLVVESDAGQGEDVDKGGRSLLPAWHRVASASVWVALWSAAIVRHRRAHLYPYQGQNKPATDGW